LLTLDELNIATSEDAATEFLKCCGSQRWAQRMVINRPYLSLEDLCLKAADLWWDIPAEDWLEAFSSHPKIGGKKAASAVSQQSKAWSGQEQASIQQAAEETLQELAQLNEEYEKKFGYIYIVCATGKSSEEMANILKTRLMNAPDDELIAAATEQAKITELRLRKMISSQ
jgi:2-oxo-4-hydroxy-4-carboxy-5-ureidoimidazoline decarboxylase